MRAQDVAAAGVARLAEQSAGAAVVSVTLSGPDGAPRTAAASADPAAALDARQAELGHGPALDAAASGRAIEVEDTWTDAAYPAFADACAEVGVRRVLSVGLALTSGTAGAVTLYGSGEEPFRADAAEAVEALAARLALAAAADELDEDPAGAAERIRVATEARAVVEQAKGVLVRDHHIGPDQAFVLLVTTSERSHRPLAEVARAIVEHARRAH